MASVAPPLFDQYWLVKGSNEIYGEELVVNFGLYIESNTNLFKEIGRLCQISSMGNRVINSIRVIVTFQLNSVNKLIKQVFL